MLDASSMTPEAMRAVARAHGHESGFVLSIGDSESDFTLRFFVPGHEMEMCGHATLGTLWLMRQAGVIGDRRVRIRTRAGIVLADIKGEDIRLSQPAATVRALGPDEGRCVMDVLGLRDDMLASPVLCIQGSRTTREPVSVALQAWATSASGMGLLAILKPAAGAACRTPWIACSSRGNGTLPIPLPMSCNADERSTALGSVMFGPLTAPICT